MNAGQKVKMTEKSRYITLLSGEKVLMHGDDVFTVVGKGRKYFCLISKFGDKFCVAVNKMEEMYEYA